jgi:spore coat polysaccharide biosynthesis protein SpsF (cytidylyltransferase family)
MLAQLGDYSLLEWVLLRAKKSKKISKIILATSVNSIDDDLVLLASKIKIPVFRGSENDVLGRFAKTAKAHNAKTIIRICGDNPFVDPGVIDSLVEFYFNSGCEYACNHQDKLDSGFPDGFGAEVFSADLLLRLDELVKDQKYREHVTLYLWDNLNEFNIRVPKAPKEISFPNLKFDVDLPKDLHYLQKLIIQNICIESSAKEIVDKALVLI